MLKYCSLQILTLLVECLIYTQDAASQCRHESWAGLAKLQVSMEVFDSLTTGYRPALLSGFTAATLLHY